MSYTIENTTQQDLDKACQLFDDAIAYQARKGFPQYKTNDRARVSKMIDKKQHFKIIIDNEIACVFGIILAEEILWGAREIGNAVYLQKIITNQEFKGRNLLSHVIEFAADYARDLDRPYVRLDTWDNNPRLEAYYVKHGFTVLDHVVHPAHPGVSENCWGGKAILMQYEVPVQS